MKDRLSVEGVLSLDTPVGSYTFIKPSHINKGKVIVVTERRNGSVEVKVHDEHHAAEAICISDAQGKVLMDWLHKPTPTFDFKKWENEY